MADESTNVVSLADHFADANPQIVEDTRVHLSEAQNGRVRSYVMLRVTNDGNVIASYFYASKADEMALGRLIDTDEITEYTD